MNDTGHEMIMCILNSGFSETVMDAAREAGAMGGTVLRGRGTANTSVGEEFGITIQPDKEMLLIVVATDVRDAVLDAVYRSAGINKAGKGIAFSLPVTKTMGLAT